MKQRNRSVGIYAYEYCLLPYYTEKAVPENVIFTSLTIHLQELCLHASLLLFNRLFLCMREIVLYFLTTESLCENACLVLFQHDCCLLFCYPRIGFIWRRMVCFTFLLLVIGNVCVRAYLFSIILFQYHFITLCMR